MPEAQNYTFTFKEVAEALVKAQDLHEGYWGLYIEFGLTAANIGAIFGPDPERDGGNLVPAAIVPLQKIGIQKFDELNNLSVDAGKVNPKRGATTGERKTRRKQAQVALQE